MDADARPRTSHDTPSTTPDGALPVLDDSHLLTRGRSSDVYLLNDTEVVRRLHDRDDTFRNVDLIRHLNAEHFPTARVVHAQGPDLIMERLNGATLLQALDVQDVGITDGVRILLDLHETLHALPLPPSGVASRVVGRGECIVHLDLHPANVLMTSDGPFLIDWESAGLGPAGLDLAMTALVFAEIVADGDEYARPAHAMLRTFTDLSGMDFREHVADAAEHRARSRTVDPEELELIPRARVIVEQELARR
ncbi:phosphotransferase [Sanguibacter sp. 25GB23B1]|uniref:aminoglycoside phosphotransferase family protein n=1 Tax=unclassified Sanguibacter TaxID=2645534 RepID=UPI0032AEEB80